MAAKKPNDRYRICGDYSVTINKFPKVLENSIPKVSELHTKLNGSKTFGKLDFPRPTNR